VEIAAGTALFVDQFVCFGGHRVRR
jgi:hypothetical protein